MLVERGHQVFGTTTRHDRVSEIADQGATPLLMDGLDARAVGGAVAAAEPEAIIHEMTALTGTPDFKHFDRWFAKTNQLRTTGTQHLVDAAQATSTVQRLIVQSYTGWTSDERRSGLATEDEPFDTHPLPQQRETLDAISRQEQLVLNASLDGVVLRYASLYGREALAASVQMLEKRRFPIVGSGAGVWSWLHVQDAAAATVAALESTATGIYNVADDDPAAVDVWLPYLAKVAGTPAPMRLPAFVAKVLIGDVGVRMMTRLRGVSNAKIKRELGWRPIYPNWREGFRTIVQRQPTKELIHVPIS